MASLGIIPQGTVGAWIELVIKDQDGVAVDISSASSKIIRFMPPAAADDAASEDVHGTIADRTATNTTDGTDGAMRWMTTTGSLDTRGTWRVMGIIVIGTSTFPTTTLTMDVTEVIAAP